MVALHEAAPCHKPYAIGMEVVDQNTERTIPNPTIGAPRPKTGIPYYRVSTSKQSLGLDAQRSAVEAFARNSGLALLPAMTEVETGTSKRHRPILARAIERCRLTGSSLIIARLDRLARSVYFVSSLMESGVEFVALDVPSANRLTLHVLAAVAENEARITSSRTKEALAAARARGTKLGNGEMGKLNFAQTPGNPYAVAAIKRNADHRARSLAEIIAELRPGRTLRQLAEAMNDAHIRTPRGGKWYACSLSRLIQRIERLGLAH